MDLSSKFTMSQNAPSRFSFSNFFPADDTEKWKQRKREGRKGKEGGWKGTGEKREKEEGEGKETGEQITVKLEKSSN
jgi:hypothetical protein